MAGTVRIRVFDSRLFAMNAPGGDVHGWMARIQDDTVVMARFYCPKRTGELSASIRGTIGYNQLGVFVNVYAETHYAKYVHEGTTGPIFPRTAPYLRWVGWGPWAGKIWRRKYVQGQRAQPFLYRAMRRTLRRRGIGTL